MTVCSLRTSLTKYAIQRILNSFVRIVHTICARTIIIPWIAYFVKDVLKGLIVMLYLVKSFLRALWNLKHNRRLFDSFLLSLFSTLKKKIFPNICCGTAHNFQSRACKKFTMITKLLSVWRATTTRFDFDIWFLIFDSFIRGLLNRGQ